MQAGILQTITYPTGGSTSFVFEANRQGNLKTANPDKIQMGIGVDDVDLIYSVISNVNPVQITSNCTGMYDPTNTVNPVFRLYSIMNVNDAGQDVSVAFSLKNGTNSNFVQPGKYRLRVSNPKKETTPKTISLTWQNDDLATASNIMVGGLRVKQTIDFDPLTSKQIVTNFSYN